MRWSLVVVLILVFSVMGVCDINCDSCDSCNSALSSAYEGQTVCLTQDILNYNGTCINDPDVNANVTFDGLGHTIKAVKPVYFYLGPTPTLKDLNLVSTGDYGIHIAGPNTTVTIMDTNVCCAKSIGIFIYQGNYGDVNLVNVRSEYNGSDPIQRYSYSGTGAYVGYIGADIYWDPGFTCYSGTPDIYCENVKVTGGLPAICITNNNYQDYNGLADPEYAEVGEILVVGHYIPLTTISNLTVKGYHALGGTYYNNGIILSNTPYDYNIVFVDVNVMGTKYAVISNTCSYYNKFKHVFFTDIEYGTSVIDSSVKADISEASSKFCSLNPSKAIGFTSILGSGNGYYVYTNIQDPPPSETYNRLCEDYVEGPEEQKTINAYLDQNTLDYSLSSTMSNIGAGVITFPGFFASDKSQISLSAQEIDGSDANYIVKLYREDLFSPVETTYSTSANLSSTVKSLLQNCSSNICKIRIWPVSGKNMDLNISTSIAYDLLTSERAWERTSYLSPDEPVYYGFEIARQGTWDYNVFVDGFYVDPSAVECTINGTASTLVTESETGKKVCLLDSRKYIYTDGTGTFSTYVVSDRTESGTPVATILDTTETVYAGSKRIKQIRGYAPDGSDSNGTLSNIDVDLYYEIKANTGYKVEWEGSVYYLSPQDTNDCNTDTPTWTEETIDGVTWRSCTMDWNSTHKYFKVRVPHLSDANIELTSSDDSVAPEIVSISPEQGDTEWVTSAIVEFSARYTDSGVGIAYCEFKFYKNGVLRETKDVPADATGLCTYTNDNFPLYESDSGYVEVSGCDEVGNCSGYTTSGQYIRKITTPSGGGGGGGGGGEVIVPDFSIEPQSIKLYLQQGRDELRYVTLHITSHMSTSVSLSFEVSDSLKNYVFIQDYPVTLEPEKDVNVKVKIFIPREDPSEYLEGTIKVHIGEYVYAIPIMIIRKPISIVASSVLGYLNTCMFSTEKAPAPVRPVLKILAMERCFTVLHGIIVIAVILLLSRGG